MIFEITSKHWYNETEGTGWDKRFTAKTGYESWLIVAYSLSKQGSHLRVDYSDRKTREFFQAKNGRIGKKDYGQFWEGEYTFKSYRHPVILFDNLPLITETIPDEKAKVLLRELSQESLRVLEPTEGERLMYTLYQ